MDRVGMRKFRITVTMSLMAETDKRSYTAKYYEILKTVS